MKSNTQKINGVTYRVTILGIFNLRASALVYLDKQLDRIAGGVVGGSPTLILGDWRVERAILSRALADAFRGGYNIAYWLVPRHRGTEGDFCTLVRPLNRVRDLGDTPEAIYLVDYTADTDKITVYEYEEQTEPQEEQTEPQEEQTEPQEEQTEPQTEPQEATRYTVYIGLNDRDTKRQERTTEDARRLTAEAVARLFGFGTILDGFGVYTHENGTTVQEQTLIVTITGDTLNGVTLDKVKVFARVMRDTLNQESVYIERQIVGALFV